MTPVDSTSWTLIQGAASGRPADREEFARRYENVIRASLEARWRRAPPLLDLLDDATQEVFLTCFQEESPLNRVDPTRPGGFRAFLYGIVRNIARRFEEKRIRGPRQANEQMDLDELAATDDSPARAFDREWARSIIRQAVKLQTERAHEADGRALRRVELLRLRFQEGLPIRRIAEIWETEARPLHFEYVRARAEFRAALQDVVAWNHAGTPAEIETECAQLVEDLG